MLVAAWGVKLVALFFWLLLEIVHLAFYLAAHEVAHVALGPVLRETAHLAARGSDCAVCSQPGATCSVGRKIYDLLAVISWVLCYAHQISPQLVILLEYVLDDWSKCVPDDWSGP